MNLWKINWLAALVVLMAVGTSCHRKDNKQELSTPTSGEVVVYADESFRPVVEPLLQVFNGIYPYASVRCEYQPEREVLKNLLEFKTPMIFATRRLSSAEKAFFELKKYFPRENLFAADAIALIVNPSITDSLVSVDQIRDILTGKIKTWKELGFQGEDRNIQVVFDNTESGTVRFMKDTICHGQPFGPGLTAVKGNQEVIRFVSDYPGALGIIGVSWVSNSRDPGSIDQLKRIRVLRVSPKTPALPDESFLPYQSFIFNGSYPLIRHLYVINAEPRNGLATGVASFVCSDRGQRIILKAGIMPAYQVDRNIKITD